jgi:hypothetical protein
VVDSVQRGGDGPHREPCPVRDLGPGGRPEPAEVAAHEQDLGIQHGHIGWAKPALSVCVQICSATFPGSRRWDPHDVEDHVDAGSVAPADQLVDLGLAQWPVVERGLDGLRGSLEPFLRWIALRYLDEPLPKLRPHRDRERPVVLA